MEYLSSWISSPGAVFFLFVNVLIGAIVVTSRGQQGGRAASTRRLCRSASSMVLDRLRSFSMFSFQFQTPHLEESYYTLELEAEEQQQQPEPPPAVAEPPVTAPASVPPPRAAAAADESSSERAKEEEGEAGEDESIISSDKADGPSLHGGAEQSPSSGDAAVVVAAAEATVAAAVAECQAAEVAGAAAAAVQRARACREEALEGKATLNARAELFIRQFKEDLKLQRLNSIMNYTRALRRGAGAAPATAHQ